MHIYCHEVYTYTYIYIYIYMYMYIDILLLCWLLDVVVESGKWQVDFNGDVFFSFTAWISGGDPERNHRDADAMKAKT